MLLEHLAETFPRHIQIHYGLYQREELFEAARRSRACADLADDDHGPLALQEILVAGRPTVGVATGAPFVECGKTGYLVEMLPPGVEYAHTLEGAQNSAVFSDGIRKAQEIPRCLVRESSRQQFATSTAISTIV
jgi:hypothetical protein